MPSGARADVRANQAQAGPALPSMPPAEASGTPLLPGSPRGQRPLWGPHTHQEHTGTPTAHTHSTRPTVLVRAVKRSFTNSTGGWVTTKVTKTKRKSCVTWVHSSEHEKGMRSVTFSSPGRTCRGQGPRLCPLPVPGRVPRPPGQLTRKAQCLVPRWTQFETRRKLQGRHEHITERKQTYTQRPCVASAARPMGTLLWCLASPALGKKTGFVVHQRQHWPHVAAALGSPE